MATLVKLYLHLASSKLNAMYLLHVVLESIQTDQEVTQMRTLWVAANKPSSIALMLKMHILHMVHHVRYTIE